MCQICRKRGKFLPIKPYDKNLLTEVRARPVIGPVVSSERTTSRNGRRNTLGSTSDSSANNEKRQFRHVINQVKKKKKRLYILNIFKHYRKNEKKIQDLKVLFNLIIR